MHPGLISCSPDTPLRTVARMMATYRVHAILVSTHGGEKLPSGGAWGVVSDTDLLRAAQTDDLDGQASRAIAATPVLTVATADELAHAAQVMTEHDLSHLIVVEPNSARPIGVLSTLDVVRALAGFPERHPVIF
jgi:CBS domain-containing protein